MSDLGKDARDLIARADAAELPSRVDRERVWQSFAARSTLVAAGAGAAAMASSKTAGASAGGSGIATGSAGLAASSVGVITKAAFVLALAGAVGGALALRENGTTPKPAAPTIAAPRPPVVPTPPVAPVVVTESPSLPSPRAGERSRAETVAAAKPAPRTERAVATLPAPAPPTEASSNPTKVGVDPKQEIDLIQRALVAEQSQDRPRLRALLDEHEARFASGILADERSVMRVLLLCAEGNEDAARALARRLDLAPQSPARLRLARSCAAQTSPTKMDR